MPGGFGLLGVVSFALATGQIIVGGIASGLLADGDAQVGAARRIQVDNALVRLGHVVDAHQTLLPIRCHYDRLFRRL